MSKNNIIRRLSCLALCFCLVSISSVSAFAGNKDSLIFGNSLKETKKEAKVTINPMQSFILDSMDNENRGDIAIELSKCSEKNISKTAKNISNILKGTWKTKNGLAKLSDILSDYLDYTPKAQYCLSSVIDGGFEGVRIPVTLSSVLKSKINYDFTGNKKDDRGIKFMVKSLIIFDEVAELDGEKLLTVKYGKNNRPVVKLNKLEDYSFITASIDEVLGSLDTLPFASDDFNGFINYYEDYINDCGVYGIFSFLRLLDANWIDYTTDK